VLFLADGRIVGKEQHPTAEAVAERMAHLGDAGQFRVGA
jgi:putative ABC transport system ATP-binding protein